MMIQTAYFFFVSSPISPLFWHVSNIADVHSNIFLGYTSFCPLGNNKRKGGETEREDNNLISTTLCEKLMEHEEGFFASKVNLSIICSRWALLSFAIFAGNLINDCWWHLAKCRRWSLKKKVWVGVGGIVKEEGKHCPELAVIKKREWRSGCQVLGVDPSTLQFGHETWRENCHISFSFFLLFETLECVLHLLLL